MYEMYPQVQEARFEEATLQNGILCSSTSFSDQTSALVVGSTSLARVYEMYQIRWKLCRRCGINQDESQDAFESELVLGVNLNHCFMCSRPVKKQQKEFELFKDSPDGKSDNTCTAKEMLANQYHDN